MKDVFYDYVKKFDLNIREIKYKYEHSLRVMDIATTIAKKSNFDIKDEHICTVSGLLHDYGRFTQWKDYETYSDIHSIDHGDLGVSLLFGNSEILNYEKDISMYDEIYDVIKYHNKGFIPTNISEHNKKICKVVRDADKLDIFYLFTIDKELIMECNEPISDKIKDDFYNRRVISYNDVKSLNDKVLLYLAFVFDLNYDYSFKHLKDNKLIDKIYSQIINKEMFKEYFDYVNKYIDERVKSYVR